MAPSELIEPSDLYNFGLLVLNTKDTDEKVDISFRAEQLFKEGKITVRPPIETTSEWQRPPSQPQRPDNITIVNPKQLHKRGAGTVENRAALLQ